MLSHVTVRTNCAYDVWLRKLHPRTRRWACHLPGNRYGKLTGMICIKTSVVSRSIVDRGWRDIANLLQHRWTSSSWLPISWPISSKRRDYCTSFWFTFKFLETRKFKFSCKPLLHLSLPTVPTILVPVLFSDIHSTRMFLSFKEKNDLIIHVKPLSNLMQYILVVSVCV